MAKEFTVAVTCPMENKRFIGGEGWEGHVWVCVCVVGGRLILHSRLVKSADRQENTQHLRHMHVWLHTCYDLPVRTVCHVCTLTATKHDGYAWAITLRKKYGNCLLRAASY